MTETNYLSYFLLLVLKHDTFRLSFLLLHLFFLHCDFHTVFNADAAGGDVR